ncbi:MAG: hypothetical protein JW862_16160, partial [Anaerolineales bacterium]|nr:hypothetical protein [Anaerolineales bacterium]
MTRIWQRIKKVFWLLLLASFVVLAMPRSELEPGDLVEQVRAFTRDLEFDYTSWGLEAALVKFGQIGLGSSDYLASDLQSAVVVDYIRIVARIQRLSYEIELIFSDPDSEDPQAASAELRQELEQLSEVRQRAAPLVEAILQNQLNTIAAEMGLARLGQALPPVLYHSTELPQALIVSPRHVIRQDANISLVPLTVDQQVALEGQIEAQLDYATLIVNVGGVGMYPTMVMQTSNLNWLAEVVAHEWAHNVLTLRPLGASYGASPELRIMNETTASIVGNEIGAALIERYYPEFVPSPPDQDTSPAQPDPNQPPPFDFRAEMRETRVTSDQLLADGQIEAAEAYMEARRQFFWENGYRIRKLNQAYFAFYGAYADAPGGAAGDDPVGAAV